MPSGVFSIAIIGAGGISAAHSGAIKASAGRLALAAAVDPVAANVERLRTEHAGAAGFASLAEFLKARGAGRVSADGVVICTPPSVRLPIVRACLSAGLHVLSEKPLAHTLADARKLAGLAAASKKTRAFVAYCHRFAPAVVMMKQMVAAGRIGRVVRFENAFACDLPGHAGKWFSDPKKSGGGAFLDMGSHSVDLFHFLIGPSRPLSAVFEHTWPRRAETAATVMVRSTAAVRGGGKHLKPGVAGAILSGWAESSRFTLSLVGDAGTLHYDYERPTELVFRDLLGKAEIISVESHDVRFARQLEAFAAAAKGAAKTDLATFADGLRAAETNDRAARMAK